MSIAAVPLSNVGRYDILRSDGNDGIVSQESEAGFAEVFEAGAVGEVGLVPAVAEAGAACPAHEEKGPAAIVGMFPVVFELEIHVDVFHQLDKLQGHGEFFAGAVSAVGDAGIDGHGWVDAQELVEERVQCGCAAEFIPDAGEGAGVFEVSLAGDAWRDVDVG